MKKSNLFLLAAFVASASAFADSCPPALPGHWDCHDIGMPGPGDETTFKYTFTAVYSSGALAAYDVIYDYDGPSPAVRWPARCENGNFISPNGVAFIVQEKYGGANYYMVAGGTECWRAGSN